MIKSNLKWIIPISSVVVIGVVSAITIVSLNHKFDIPDKYCLNEVNRTYNNKKLKVSDDYINAIKNFAANYAKNITNNNPKNEIFSPLSIVTCYSMLLEGANGDTYNELRNALGFNESIDIKNETQKMLNNTFIKTEQTQLNVNQSIWLDNEYAKNIKEDYLDKLTNYYYAEAYQDDLKSDNAKDLLARYINSKTNNILNIKKDDLRNYNGIMWLVNTIYMKSKWSAEFYETKSDFKNIKGITNTKDFIATKASYSGVYQSENSTTFSTSFQHGLQVNFMIPNSIDANFKNFVNDNNNWNNLFNYKKSKYIAGTVNFKMPKLSVKSSYDLTKELSNMGVTKIFDEDNADLTGIIEFDDLSNLYISNSMHKAAVDFNKDGVEAAAVTIIEGSKSTGIDPDAKQIDFFLDQPFIYSITDANDIPLFVGIVTNV